ncbi:MAG: hypothetical protein JSR91_06490 [Proteobacteria bacterium]|nr:hypothetical protein [Pseudomonadota bacterium]
MTLLNWEMTAEQVILFTDTLSLDGQDRRARSFTTKVFPAPHIGAVIAGTGVAQIVTRFYLNIVDLVVNDVVHLSKFAPAMLKQDWEQTKSQLPDGATTTVYTFGLSAKDGTFTGYAYRSTADFAAECLHHGRVMKPPTTIEDLQAIDSLPAFVAISKKQQAQDRELPRVKRVGIGGDLWLYFLRKSESGALSLQVERMERMPHYNQDRKIMLAKLPENASHPHALAALASDP